MDRLREIFLYAVAALALFALLGAVYQAMNRQLGSAATLGAIFLVGALIVFIPQLEVLKAWGIEARLTKTLDRAEEIIGRLRRLKPILWSESPPGSDPLGGGPPHGNTGWHSPSPFPFHFVIRP